MRVYRSDVVSLKSAEARPPRSVHRLDEPAGLSLSMVASPQCRFCFARQNYCSAAATSAANFRVARHLGRIALHCATSVEPEHGRGFRDHPFTRFRSNATNDLGRQHPSGERDPFCPL